MPRTNQGGRIMRINNNLQAINTHRQLGISTTAGSKSMEKLSSGYRINRAGDDAAGLAISEKMRGQIRGLNMASKNAQDGVSLIQTAEGALDEVHAMLQRMRELAVQASSDTNDDGIDRAALQKEVDALMEEITAIEDRAEFNGMTLLGGGFTGKVIHIGANAGQAMTVSIGKLSDMLALSSLSIANQTGADSAIDTINTAINSLSTQRSALGAIQNRLEHTIKNLDNSAENLQAAESRVRDVDMAKEMVEQTKQNILQQASTAMLAQANQAPQSVLQLLR